MYPYVYTHMPYMGVIFVWRDVGQAKMTRANKLKVATAIVVVVVVVLLLLLLIIIIITTVIMIGLLNFD